MPPRHPVIFKKNRGFIEDILNCERCGSDMNREQFDRQRNCMRINWRHTCYTCGRVICEVHCAVQDPEHTSVFYSRYYCRAHDHEAAVPADWECPICLTGGGARDVAICGHVFHTSCLRRWQAGYNPHADFMTAAHRACPLCRRRLI